MDVYLLRMLGVVQADAYALGQSLAQWSRTDCVWSGATMALYTLNEEAEKVRLRRNTSTPLEPNFMPEK